jgi:hypothetical protein
MKPLKFLKQALVGTVAGSLVIPVYTALGQAALAYGAELPFGPVPCPPRLKIIRNNPKGETRL